MYALWRDLGDNIGINDARRDKEWHCEIATVVYSSSRALSYAYIRLVMFKTAMTPGTTFLGND